MTAKSMTPDPARRFHTPRWTRVASAAAALVFVAVTAISWATNGPSWITVTLLCLVPLSIAGFADVMTARVELYDDRIVVVRNLRRREYARTAFAKVNWGKGFPVFLQRTTGEWVQLPDVGTSGQGLANTLRAWLDAST